MTARAQQEAVAQVELLEELKRAAEKLGLQVREERLLRRAAVLPGDQLGDLGSPRLQGLGQTSDCARALFRRPAGKGSVLERMARSSDRPVDIRRGRLRDAPDGLLGGRADHLDSPAALRANPLAPDEEVRSLEEARLLGHGGRTSFCVWWGI